MDIPKLPDPGTQAWEDMVGHMRKMNQYSGVIRAARTLIEDRRECLECGEIWQIDKDSTGYCPVCGSANVQHKDFNEEFTKWKKENKKNV